MRPIKIPSDIENLFNINYNDSNIIDKIKNAYIKIHSDAPDISIVIPAYNEEKTIVQTLASLCFNEIEKNIEIIVVNNNSVDKTEELVKRCGIKCLFEAKQGIAHARNAGLSEAKGKFILNADADTIYPRHWIKEISKPLNNPEITLTYGRFAFIPIGKTGRVTYFFYEHMADLSRTLNKYIKEEAVNVYGFNSAFKREQGLAVNRFDHPPGTIEDGWLALKLKRKGFGKLHRVRSPKVIVWTTDRRVQIDGGLLKGLKKRATRFVTGK